MSSQPTPAPRAALFLDRDGTLIEERDYLRRPEQVAFYPGVVQALRRAKASGFLLVMVTNQSGVGRGYFTVEDVEAVHAHIQRLLGEAGAAFDRIYYAPEAPEQPSRGRKPSPQFLFDARDDLGVDLALSHMVGDKLIDLQCGWNAGVKTSFLVRTGYGTKVERGQAAELASAVVVDSFPSVVDFLLGKV